MRCIFMMFDSLNRHMLPPYGGDWVQAPNFQRLSEKTVTFDNSFVGSMPCMPARRELHTGRLNFLHRSWGPIEPFDDSVPEMLKKNGTYTHLVTDHWHYFQEGGANYHCRFASWDTYRGHEGDPWKAEVAEPEIPPHSDGQLNYQGGHFLRSRMDWVNRKYINNVEDLPQHKTVEAGMEFMRTNSGEDNWFLQLECFDPHEPFTAQDKHRDLYPKKYDKVYDWPIYRQVEESEEEVEHLRYQYAARVSQCDEYLGNVLDLMDELDMWEDTMLIVGTDHGYMLGEHGWWAKIRMPWYNQLANTPLFIWDPRCGRKNERCNELVQFIDIAPTLLNFFGMEPTPDMLGKDLTETIANNTPVHDHVMFGCYGGYVNITDGRYVYMRGLANPENTPLYEYTLMPAKLPRTFPVEELQDIQLQEPFSFTKGCRTMKIAGVIQHGAKGVQHTWTKNLLFDNEADYAQEHPLQDEKIENMMIDHLIRVMKINEAPVEQYERLGLDPDKIYSQ